MQRALAFSLVFGALVGCEARLEGVPEGALARVGDRVLEVEDLEGVQANLGAYGQARFSGSDGKKAMLEGLIVETLLDIEGQRRGLELNPRIEWAQLEELARLQRSAELERRVPTHAVREDQAALRAWYDAHLERFSDPERRSVRMVKFATIDEADTAWAKVQSGEAQLEDFGEVVRTPLAARDDERYPAFHRLLFAPQLEAGSLLALPIYASEAMWVAQVDLIEPAKPRAFEDPAVQEALVSAVRAPKVEAAEAELLEELAARYPVAR